MADQSQGAELLQLLPAHFPLDSIQAIAPLSCEVQVLEGTLGDADPVNYE